MCCTRYHVLVIVHTKLKANNPMTWLSMQISPIGMEAWSDDILDQPTMLHICLSLRCTSCSILGTAGSLIDHIIVMWILLNPLFSQVYQISKWPVTIKLELKCSWYHSPLAQTCFLFEQSGLRCTSPNKALVTRSFEVLLLILYRLNKPSSCRWCHAISLRTRHICNVVDPISSVC